MVIWVIKNIPIVISKKNIYRERVKNNFDKEDLFTDESSKVIFN